MSTKPTGREFVLEDPQLFHGSPWHADQDEEGALKVVMAGAASDPRAMQPHIRSKLRQKAIEKRFKDPDDPLKIVIVRDMWLTGFDVPCAHTLYLDKPM